MTRSKSESQVVEAYRWANREGYKVSPSAGRVLVEILTYLDLETGHCYPKQARLASNLYDTEEPSKAQTNVVSKAVTALQNAGLIEAEQMTNRGKKTVNLYTLNVGHRAHLEWERQPSPSGSGLPSSSGSGLPSPSGSHKVSREVSKGSIHRKRGRERHLKVVEDQ